MTREVPKIISTKLNPNPNPDLNKNDCAGQTHSPVYPNTFTQSLKEPDPSTQSLTGLDNLPVLIKTIALKGADGSVIQYVMWIQEVPDQKSTCPD